MSHRTTLLSERQRIQQTETKASHLLNEKKSVLYIKENPFRTRLRHTPRTGRVFEYLSGSTPGGRAPGCHTSAPASTLLAMDSPDRTTTDQAMIVCNTPEQKISNINTSEILSQELSTGIAPLPLFTPITPIQFKKRKRSEITGQFEFCPPINKKAIGNIFSIQNAAKYGWPTEVIFWRAEGHGDVYTRLVWSGADYHDANGSYKIYDFELNYLNGFKSILEHVQQQTGAHLDGSVDFATYKRPWQNPQNLKKPKRYQIIARGGSVQAIAV